MKSVLVISDGTFHPPLLGRMALHRALAEMTGFRFTRVSSIELLPPNLKDFSALVIYVHHKKISNRSLAALDSFVSHGGGLVGIHSATASFKQQKQYFEILGGRFTGHGKVEPFEIRPTPGSAIFQDIPAFTVKDELYLHELQPGIIPHFTASCRGREIPVVWTHTYGQGRVCYAVPGHRAQTMQNPAYRRLLQRGLAWAAQEAP